MIFKHECHTAPAYLHGGGLGADVLKQEDAAAWVAGRGKQMSSVQSPLLQQADR